MSALKPIEGRDDLLIPLMRVCFDATYEDIKDIARKEFFCQTTQKVH